ncbi:dihydrofolate reductase family protein [Pseudomonas cavernae]|uniref:dihydrofolate reductase family protein n=1 Tax=Pseudomonas cavernae TaxID=2320867 RepID=UPI001C49B4F2|nr:dihydrofolate reductase family protein [Pseudomonas cavernae]
MEDKSQLTVSKAPEPMRKLIASTFTSLDGVMQAPGGPTEDPTGNFTLGGWSFTFWDEVMDLSASGFDGKDRELVLGRKTYEIFEAHWPYQPEDDPIAKTLNAAKKHVASRTLKSLQWNNSTVLGGDILTYPRSRVSPDTTFKSLAAAI